MKLTSEVKTLAIASGLDYVGIAPAELLENEPEGLRPSDFLPGAKTVISVGIKLALGVQLVNKLAHSHSRPRHLIYSYLWHGFGLPSLHFVDRTSLQIVRLIEKEDFLAVPIMAASSFDIRSSLTEFSNAHAAVAAGLGELGWSGSVITPEIGPRVRFGSIITTANLDTDPMYSGSRMCDPVACKKKGQGLPVCASICPTQAIGAATKEIVIGKKRFEVAKVDRWRCMWGSMGLCTSSLGLKDIPLPEVVDAAAILNGLKQRDPSQTSELIVIGRGDYCGKCLMECPAGSPQKVNKLIPKPRKKEK